jgi:hypothetical protein
VNPAETPIDTLRSLRAKPETRATPPRPETPASAEFEPRYVQVPRRRRAQLAAERNLKWGLAVLLLTLGLLGAALIVVGPRALVPLVVCLVTFTILWAMARLHVFHQRNGVFFATAMVCLLGAAIPLIERGYFELDRMVHAERSGAAEAIAAVGSGEPDPILDKSPEAASEPPAFVEAYKIKPPIDMGASLVRVVEDTRIIVGRKPYLLRSGDTFALEDVKDGQVTFVANGLRLSVPEKAVEVITSKVYEPVAANSPPGTAPAPRVGPPSVSDEEPAADVTARARGEAIRRYPGIGVKDSPENKLFLERFHQLQTDRPEFFDEAQWPLYLAEALAKEQSWQRAQ